MGNTTRADRVVFVAVPRHGHGLRGGQGALDAEAVAERMRQPDAAFDVVTIDAGDDVAGQIDDYFEGAGVGSADAVLFFASCRVTASEGELLLLLDGEHPETGDALGDVLDALRESGAAYTMLLFDVRHASTDQSELVELAELARAAARKDGGVVETVFALRSAKEEQEIGAEQCSPFTRAMLAELDDTDPALGLYANELVERVRAGAKLASASNILSYVGGDPSFPFLIAIDEPVQSQRPVLAEPPELSEEEPEATDPNPDEAIASGPRSDSEVTEVRRDTEVAPPPVSSAAPSTLPSPTEPPPAASPPAPPPPAPPAPPVPSVPAPPLSSPPAAPSRPSTPPAPSEVLAEADKLVAEGQDEASLALFRKALSLVGATGGGPDPDAERARIHARIGEVKLRQGKAREAIASLEKGLSLSPNMGGADRALATLLTLYRGEKDHRSVHRVEERILSRIEDEADLIPSLIAFGKSWMTDLHDPLRARERLEHARALAPESPEVLRLLLALAGQDGRAEEARGLKRRLADLDPDPRARAAALFDIGRDLLKSEREDEGLDLLEAALDADPTALEPLAMMSRLLGDRQEWGELEGAYRRMLDRARAMDEPPASRPGKGRSTDSLSAGLTHELEKRLGVLLHEHLDDPDGALEAFERAIAARPNEAGVRRATAELAVSLGKLDVAEQTLLGLIAIEPRDEAALHSLFDVFVRTEQVERAFDVASVLTVLGATTDRERAVFGSHKPDDIARPRGSFAASFWPGLRAPVTGAGAEPEQAIELVGGVFRAAGSAIVKAFFGLASRAGRLPPLDEKLRVDPETSTVSVARSLAWASKVIGIAPPAIYLEEASAEGMTAVLRHDPVTVAGSGALRGRSLAELAFISGYHLTGHLPEHRLTRLCPALDDLAACFLAAVVVAVPDTPVPERIHSLVELLVPNISEALDAEAEAELEEAVMAFDEAGGRADLARFQRAVERASLRTGLLLCGSLEAAVAMCDVCGPGQLSKEDRKSELFAWIVSDRYRELRARIGAD